MDTGSIVSMILVRSFLTAASHLFAYVLLAAYSYRLYSTQINLTWWQSGIALILSTVLLQLIAIVLRKAT